MTSSFKLAAASLLLATSSLAMAQDAPAKGKDKSIGESNAERMKDEAEAGYANAPVAEQEVKTRGSVAVAGRTLGYTATAGTLTIRDIEGKPTASMFYTAYTLDGVRPGTRRPITFLYNGGPGSPSFWLHMGSFAPVRLKTGNPEFIHPAPYDFGPNPDTLLDKTDMVFLDAIGTGYSRPLGDAKPKDFYGTDEDADVFAKGILRYATKNGRWNSPKFIFGESYGTLRSGALAYELQDRGMALNGVDPALDHPQLRLSSSPGYDQSLCQLSCRAMPPPPGITTSLANRPRRASAPFGRRGRARSRLAPMRMVARAQGDTLIADAEARRDGGAAERATPACRPTIIRKRQSPGRSQRASRRSCCAAPAHHRSAGSIQPLYRRWTPTPPARAPTATPRRHRDRRARSSQPSTTIVTRDAQLPDRDALPVVSALWPEGVRLGLEAQVRPVPTITGPRTIPDVALDLGTAMRNNPYLKVLLAKRLVSTWRRRSSAPRTTSAT